MAGEVLLVRLLSFRFWPHLVPLVISQAMLGLGAAGVLLEAARTRVARAPATAFAWSVVVAAPALDLAHRASLLVPLDPFLLLWDAAAWPAFFAYFAVLSVPFLLAGLATGMPLAFGMERTGIVYAAGFAGSAAGAALALGALALLPTSALLKVPTALGLAAALLVVRRGARGLSRPRAAAAGAALVVLALPAPAPVMSPYKDLAVALRLPGARIVASRSGPSGDFRAVASPGIHSAPGLSLHFDGEVPPQALVFRDGEAAGVVPRLAGAPPAYLAHVPAALAHRLLAGGDVLLVGLHGTEGILAAAARGARSVTAVEPAAELADLVLRDLAPASGGWPEGLSVEVSVAEPRAFLARERRRFALVDLGDVSSLTFASLGVHAAGESYLLTREGIRAALARLGDRGLLAFSGWLKVPPRESVKALATIRAELEAAGAAPAAERVIVVRGGGRFAAVARRAPFDAAEHEAVRRFCAEEGFRMVWPAGPAGPEERPEDRAVATALRETLAGGGASAGGLFDLRPATDDAPYFHRFLRLDRIPEFRRALGAQWAPLVEWGVLFQVLSLPVSLVVAAALLVLPVARRGAARGRLGALGCFAALGVGYLLVEMAWLKAGSLVAPSAAAAAAAALGGFTLFSGLGSAASSRLTLDGGKQRLLFLALVLAIPLCFLALQGVAPALLRAGGAVRLAALVASLALPAFLMGFPFPAALARLLERDPGAAPLALAVNGLFSVAGATLASLSALWLGFRATALAAAACYLVAAVLFPGPRRGPAPG